MSTPDAPTSMRINYGSERNYMYNQSDYTGISKNTLLKLYAVKKLAAGKHRYILSA